MASSSSSKSIDFAELQECADVVNRVTELDNSIDSLEKLIETAINQKVTATLTQEEKVKLDLFLAYSLNSFFWMYLRTQGKDPNKHGVKGELERIKNYLTRAKEVNDRKTMPRINKNVAQRFVKSGLWDPEAKMHQGKNKKRKFTELDQD